MPYSTQEERSWHIGTTSECYRSRGYQCKRIWAVRMQALVNGSVRERVEQEVQETDVIPTLGGVGSADAAGRGTQRKLTNKCKVLTGVTRDI